MSFPTSSFQVISWGFLSGSGNLLEVELGSLCGTRQSGFPIISHTILAMCNSDYSEYSNFKFNIDSDTTFAIEKEMTSSGGGF